MADVVAANVGFVKSLSAAIRGQMWVCGKTAQLLRDLAQPPPAASPSPSPYVPEGCSQAALEAVGDPACKRCAKHVAMQDYVTCGWEVRPLVW
ncbi:hypothetical protein OEZ86_013857 [Tetradesmus obliquus]|nr:hypothetical protein OEZ86_013857 [Tetradesmus obliquus]